MLSGRREFVTRRGSTRGVHRGGSEAVCVRRLLHKPTSRTNHPISRRAVSSYSATTSSGRCCRSKARSDRAWSCRCSAHPDWARRGLQDVVRRTVLKWLLYRRVSIALGTVSWSCASENTIAPPGGGRSRMVSGSGLARGWIFRISRSICWARLARCRVFHSW